MINQDWKNQLFFGDNLAILREHVPDESVDLIYLDPPFNSNATYNVLFKEKSGEQSTAQITAFDDTWHWGLESQSTYFDTVLKGGKLGDLLQALYGFLGQNDMMAYLVMMAPRLVELRRVLKPTGSIYLHCDTTASHYLKLVMDAIFGAVFFRNEIVWQRTSAHNDPKKYGRIHDVLFFYTKGDEYVWNQQYSALTDDNFSSHDFEVDEEGRKYRKRDLTAPAHGGSSGQYEWKGMNPPHGRMWSYTKENMEQLELQGRIVYTRTGMPRLKIYVEDLRGVPYQDVWAKPDLWLNSAAAERLGYPTQKPEALLERIINTSSNIGDIVLDPFCGCGTAIHAAERLHRCWIGIDITHIAITLIKNRLRTAFGADLLPYTVDGDPKDIESARSLAELDRYQFECWALGLVDSRPANGKKKGADKGIDGFMNFFDDGSNIAKKAVVQVKSGHVNRSQIGDLNNARIREKAELAVFVTLEESTDPMRKEAAAVGFYTPDYFPGMKVPRVQILTIAELLAGKSVQVPIASQAQLSTFKAAAKVQKTGGLKQGSIFDQHM
jgi:site-specific DNA-methyltransferase (adenine-specific)